MEIRPGLHRVVAPLRDRFVALYLLRGPEATVLVDTGVDESIGGTLLPYLERVGISPLDVTHVINTHCDFDHVGGNEAIKQFSPGVRVMCHAADAPLAGNLEMLIKCRYGEFRESDFFDDPPEATEHIRTVARLAEIDAAVRDGDTIDLGDRRVTIVHTPGHSPGHIAVHDVENGAMCVGDAVLGDSVLTSAGRPAFPPTYRDVQPYLETVAKISAAGPELLLTAHYPVYEGSEAQEFLELTSNYAARLESHVLAALTDSRAPLTTMQIVRTVAPAVGSWVGGAADYLVFPVVGHLERLVAQEVIVSDESLVPRTWALRSA